MNESGPPADSPADSSGLIAGFSVDLHDLTLLVPAVTPPRPGTTVALQLRGRDGMKLRALGRVEREVASAEGRPRCMAVRLLDVRPLHERPLIHMESLRPPSLFPPEGHRPVRVLVVDDDPSLRRLASAAVQAAGFEVVEASNGAQALRQASRGEVDLILTDVNMPLMDGWQLLRMVRAREDLRHLPVIFLTTLQSERDRMRGYAQGVDDYIDKPFKTEDLADRVNRLLDRSRAPSTESGSGHSLRGDLRRVSLGSLLSFLDGERHTGLLRLSRPGEQAEIRLRQGEVCGAVIDPAPAEPLEPLARIFRLLDWKDGEFELSSLQAADGTDDPHSEPFGPPIPFMLLEHARLSDEAAERGE